MDLSALIFVVLALAWGAYLIPKALKHHDEAASEQLEESHSERARVLSRRRTADYGAEDAPVESEVEVEVETTRTVRRRVPARLTGPLAALTRRRAARPELSTAGRAARNRRRVLAGLLVVLAATWAFTWFAYLPAITPLWPTLAVVGWLVLARVSVVKMQRARRSRPARPAAEPAAPVERVVPVEAEVPAPVATATVQAPVRQPATASELQRLSFDQRPEVVAEREALADDGSLWDPLPLTLPTYVGKATARRTVRTIELTGMTSSGHDEADSALAREAEAARVLEAEEAAETERQRRVAGA